MNGAPRVCTKGTIPSILFDEATERADGEDKIITIYMSSIGTISKGASRTSWMGKARSSSPTTTTSSA